MTSQNEFKRGAEWRQWDLHIHTPASFHWSGKRFVGDANSAENIALVDEMIAAINEAKPAVFALMDYWTFDGWFALKRRLAQAGAPKLLKRVFPGIELRLKAPMDGRLNAHVLFSDEIEDQMLHDFKAALLVEFVGRPLSDSSLIALARKVGEDKLKHHSFKKAEIDASEDEALRAGSVIAEINCDSYKSAIEKVPNGYSIGFMPFSTSDGLEEIKWQEHYAYVLGLFKSSPIFETRNLDIWGAFAGERTAGNEKWIDNFQKALGGIPRLAVSGSDAHVFKGAPRDNNNRGYGDYPSGKATWIKADPTFLGLLQAIKEPANRSYIGEQPDKLTEVAQNKTFFIDKVVVRKNAGSQVQEEWLSDCDLPLNHDLVAIIGNKGSGKSALADVIALLGNSKQQEHFSFLSSKRFRAKPKEFAKHFRGQITWCDQTTSPAVSLADDPEPTSVELVRYIPQAHFEKLCNDHVSGRTDVFEKELRAVIFAHTNSAIRQKALDFDLLIEQQESSYRDQLGEFRKDLKRLNEEIESTEAQLQPDVRKSLDELLTQKLKQIEEHIKITPIIEPQPSDLLSAEQQEAATRLEDIATRLKVLEEDEKLDLAKDAELAAKIKATQSLRERIKILQRQFKQFGEETAADLVILGINLSDIAELSTHESAIDAIAEKIPEVRKGLIDKSESGKIEKQKLLAEQAPFKAKLNEPQLRHQQSLKAFEIWQDKLHELNGSIDLPDTLEGVKARLQQLDKLPDALLSKREKRIKLAEDIFGILEAQRQAREDLFAPVQDVIQRNQLIRDEYKLQFQATLGGSSDALAAALFSLIKQSSTPFRGEEDSYATIKKVSEKYDLSKKSDVIQFVSELHTLISLAANNGDAHAVGISSILRTAKAQSGINKSPSDVYDLLFGLSFLEPRYSLLFQDAQIEHLSPGQRGALLLIFYLLVDKGRNPIILDQPEENLDNETVVNLLVPVLNEAKKSRQIIMVTHNPNLAVVCDAEQVIYSSFNRKEASKITYTSGGIENSQINKHVVNTLEGTKRAFDNRRGKYHEHS